MKSRSAVIHVVAECEDCGWTDQDYLKGQQRAYQHARNKGHFVKLELGKAVEYNGRKEK